MAAPAPPRPISIAKPTRTSRASGVLPAPTAAEKPQITNVNGISSRPPVSRLKIVVRRLAPGLTEEEFSSTLGDEWKVGNSRVDWASYKPGKLSKDPNKPSRPARVYLHLTSDQYLAQLSDKVRKTPFADAKASSNDSILLGQPVVEFATYSRLPTSKPRRDARQGTIDQDQEFIDFLESLTNPLPRTANVDAPADKEIKPDDLKTVTPLIQYIKDKKANKGKETASPVKTAKHARQESKETKTSQTEKKSQSKTSKDAVSVPDKKITTPPKVEKPPREAAKPSTKQPSSTAKATPAKATPPTTPKSVPEQTPSQAPSSSAPKQERRRERGSASAAARILQRDLGISSSPQSRRKRDNTPTTSATKPEIAQASSESVKENKTGSSVVSGSVSAASPAAASSTAAAASPKQPPTAPAAVRNQAKANPPPVAPKAQSSNSNAPKPQSLPTITPGATQAFLKHANPSQGVTEPLLEEAFSSYGTVQKVEIDKKKGFAYIDFAEPDSLQKAIAASPIKVAQGQVVVLERKTGASLHNRNARPTGPAPTARGGSGPQAARGSRGGGRGRGRTQGGSSKPAVSHSTGTASGPSGNSGSQGAVNASTPSA